MLYIWDLTRIDLFYEIIGNLQIISLTCGEGILRSFPIIILGSELLKNS